MNIDINHHAYRKLLMTNLIYLFALSVLIIFSVINIFIKGKLLAGTVEAIFIIPTIYGYLKLRHDHNIEKYAAYVSYQLFLMIVSVLFLFHYQEYVAAWALLFPFVAMSLRGPKKGLYLVILFNLVIYGGAFYHLYQNDISLMSVIRIINILLFISILVYLYEVSITLSYRKQQVLHKSLKKSMRKAEQLAITDALTGLHNKRYFDLVFKDEFNRAKREHKAFNFAILDIDNFKPYNDTYGHDSGNSALQKVGEILKQHTTRSADYALRIGGEEFALIVQSVTTEDFQLYLDNLRQKIESLQLEHINNKPYNVITISIGAVSIEDYQETTLSSVYREADQNLYYVKRNGRNGIKLTIIAEER
jgi:diguanylate cyclase (GGDEF)-like protein